MGSCGARPLSRLQAWQGPINEVDPAPDGLGRRARRPSHAEAPKKGMSPRTARLEDITSQRDALEKLAELIRKGSIDQEILRAAKAVTRDCSARDDLCELEALFQPLKYSHSPPPPPAALVAAGSLRPHPGGGGAGGGPGHAATILVGSLAASIGFMVGAR